MPEEPGRRKATPWQIASAVIGSFLGIRKRSAHESDIVRLKPAQVIAAGIAGAAIFVVCLILIVRFVISRAG